MADTDGSDTAGSAGEDAPRSKARVLVYGAFACAVVALFFLPPVFGIAGMVLGGVAHSKGDKLGLPALGVSLVAAVVGVLIGLALFVT